MAQLGKMALTVSGATAGATGGAVLSGAKLTAATLIVLAGVGGFLAFRRNPPQPQP